MSQRKIAFETSFFRIVSVLDSFPDRHKDILIIISLHINTECNRYNYLCLVYKSFSTQDITRILSILLETDVRLSNN